MRYLTPQQVLFIHSNLINQTGGTHGVRNLGMLASAVARPRASFGGENEDPSLFDKTATLLDSLINNHPFMDGNKRTGITAAAIMLRKNGYILRVAPVELESFTFTVALEHPPIETLVNWLKKYSIQNNQ